MSYDFLHTIKLFLIMCLLIKLNEHCNNGCPCFSICVFDMRINNKKTYETETKIVFLEYTANPLNTKLLVELYV